MRLSGREFAHLYSVPEIRRADLRPPLRGQMDSIQLSPSTESVAGVFFGKC